MNKLYHKLHYSTVIFFLIFLPFNALMQVIFKYKLNFGAIGYLKEIALIVILIANLISILKFKNWDLAKNKLLRVISIFLLYIVTSSLWLNDPSLKSLIYGFKYDGFMFLVLIAGATLPLEITKKTEQLLKITFSSYSLAISIGIFFHFVLSPANLVEIGYRNDWSTYYANSSLAFCQKIEHNETCRFQGIFSGPNQAGANLILYISLGFYLLKSSSKKLRIAIGFAIAVALALLVITYSRSSWLAMIALIGLYAITQQGNIRKTLLAIGGFLIILIAGVLIKNPEFILRYSSNSDRIQLMLEGFRIFTENPWFGMGISSSGPASHFSDRPIITENWFLQVLINYGLVGFGLFALIYGKIAKNTKFWGILMVALIVPLSLLHYFEDSSFSYTLFLILGLFLNKNANSSLAAKS